MKVGAKLYLFNYSMRNKRARMGLTQANLAKLVDVHPSVISEIELFKKPNVREVRVMSLLEDIADQLDIPFHQIFPDDYLNLLERGGMKLPLFIVKDIDVSMLSQSDTPLLEPPDIQLEEKELNNYLQSLIGELPPIEREIIELRYGLNNGESQSLKEVADKFHITGERVRQIEARALSRLRRESRQLRALCF
jgi:RNA polymerase nonessential primary-like sigma factor